MSIFKDGYLKSEFINPNYRGLVGWPCEYHDDSGFTGDVLSLKTILKGALYTDSEQGVDQLDCELGKIKQFTPKDIPVGELCWIGYMCKDIAEEDDSIQWDFVSYDNDNERYHRDADFCVPYLIAETADKAEELIDWAIV